MLFTVFRWREFKPSSVGLMVCNGGGGIKHTRDDLALRRDSPVIHAKKNVFIEHTSCRIF